MVDTPQYSPEFLNADAYVAYQEGGKTNDDGGGHRASFGIDEKANPTANVEHLTPLQAQAIRYNYWKAINGDAWAKADPRMALMAYDTAVLMGPKSGPEAAFAQLKKSGGSLEEMHKIRMDYIDQLVAAKPELANVAKNWRNRTNDLGQTVGIIPGTPRTPPVSKLIGPEGVYVPPGYAANVDTPVPIGGKSSSPLVAAQSPLTPQTTPELTPTEQVTDDLSKGIFGAVAKQQEAQNVPKIEAPKPNVALPEGSIAPDRRELYAKALEKISSRANAAPGQASPVAGNPVAPQETYQEKTAREAQSSQVSAPKQEQVPQNDEAA